MTFIVAEVGSNFQSLKDCLDSIVAAKEAGADAVKFQMYTHKELYGYDEIEEYLESGLVQYRAKKQPGELPREWVPLLHAKCQEVGIEFMITAFSPDGYRFIDPYVKRHKIASAENTDKDILKTVKELGKPILMSTGGSSLQEIKESWDYLVSDDPNLNLDVILMYCVSAYPAKNIDFSIIRELVHEVSADTRNSNIGYSCHTDEWITPVTAIRSYGFIEVIEKHFKIREMDTPDNPHSILPGEFKKMVDAIHHGLHMEMPHPDEADFIKYAKRRWVPELNGYYRTKKP